MASECLQCQLEELEALQAMYPEPGALELSTVEQDNLAYARQACAATGSGMCSPCDVPELSATLRLPGCTLGGAALQLRFQFPQAYPALPLKLHILTAAPRAQADALHQAVQAATEENVGAPCLLLAVAALQEAAAAVQEQQDQPGSSAATGASAGHQAGAAQRPPRLRRVAIWFHHIKNLGKRRCIVQWAHELKVQASIVHPLFPYFYSGQWDQKLFGCIVQWAHELKLGGYSKPGFPGVVIVEGEDEDVEEYLRRLRGLQWQAMSVRGEEWEEPAPAAVSAIGSGSKGSEPNGGVVAPQLQPPIRKFAGRFAEVAGEDTSRLAALCREAGLEQLFLTALKLGSSGQQQQQQQQ